MRKLFLLFFLITAKGHTQDLYSPNNTYKYAQYLIAIENYKLAIPELERLHFQQKTDSIAGPLLLCYRKSRQFDVALSKYHKTIEKGPIQETEYIKTLLQGGKYDLVAPSLDQSQYQEPLQKFKYLLHTQLLSANYTQANLMLASGKFEPSNFETEQSLIKLANANTTKNVGLATALSMVVPGAGKAYSRNWKDGLVSFIMVAGTAFQSYRSFKKLGPNHALGYIYGGLSAGFYLGNIVGTNKEAKKYNNLQKEKVGEKIRDFVFMEY